jgi:hypothetical protein
MDAGGDLTPAETERGRWIVGLGLQIIAIGVAVAVQRLGMAWSIGIGGTISAVGIAVLWWPRVKRRLRFLACASLAVLLFWLGLVYFGRSSSRTFVAYARFVEFYEPPPNWRLVDEQGHYAIGISGILNLDVANAQENTAARIRDYRVEIETNGTWHRLLKVPGNAPGTNIYGKNSNSDWTQAVRVVFGEPFDEKIAHEIVAGGSIQGWIYLGWPRSYGGHRSTDESLKDYKLRITLWDAFRNSEVIVIDPKERDPVVEMFPITVFPQRRDISSLEVRPMWDPDKARRSK